MFFILIGAVPFLYVLGRCIWPLRASRATKFALTMILFLVAFKFQILRRFAGPMFFAPELPNWILALAAWAFTSLLGFMIFMIAADAARFAVWLVRRIARRPRLPWARSFDAGVNLALLTLSCVVTAWGMVNAASIPEVRRYDRAFRTLPRELDGFRIVLLADLHIDKLTERADIEELVRRANALRPDLVALAGDFADGTVEKLRDKAAPLAGLRAKYGVVGIPGNHEYYSGYHEWLEHLRSLGIVMLENETRRPVPGFSVVGITDPAALRRGMEPPDLKKALAGVPKGDFKLLLAHQLRNTREAAGLGVDLQLSGHTHGGMARGLDRLVAAGNEGFVAGWYRVGGMALYVSRGTFIWKGYPLRLGVPSEITLITLRCK